MSPIDFFGTRGCVNCRRALSLLATTDRTIRARDLIEEPLSWDELKRLAGMAGGVRHLLSVQAPAYGRLDLARAQVREPELIAYMLVEPWLLRRPIIHFDGLVLVGFDDANREARTARARRA